MESFAKTLTVTEAKKKFLELVDDIAKTRDSVVLTKNGVPTTVIMSLDDYESVMETLEIMADPAIMKSLKKSRGQARKGKLLDDSEVWE